MDGGVHPPARPTTPIDSVSDVGIRGFVQSAEGPVPPALFSVPSPPLEKSKLPVDKHAHLDKCGGELSDDNRPAFPGPGNVPESSDHLVPMHDNQVDEDSQSAQTSLASGSQFHNEKSFSEESSFSEPSTCELGDKNGAEVSHEGSSSRLTVKPEYCLQQNEPTDLTIKEEHLVAETTSDQTPAENAGASQQLDEATEREHDLSPTASQSFLQNDIKKEDGVDEPGDQKYRPEDLTETPHSPLQDPGHLKDCSPHFAKYTEPLHGPQMNDSPHLHSLRDNPVPDYGDSHPMASQRHLSDHQSHANESYWNMHLEVLSKLKSEIKEWYHDGVMISDNMGSGSSDAVKSEHSSYPVVKSEHGPYPVVKSEHGPYPVVKSEHGPYPVVKSEHGSYPNFRLPPLPPCPDNSRTPSMNSPHAPHLGPPYSQASVDQQHQPQHYQPYENHNGMRDMSPLSPGYPRPQHLHHPPDNLQMGHQHPSLQQHQGGGQHMQHTYSGQYGGQQPMGYHGQQMTSPYPSHGLGGQMGMGGPHGGIGHDGRDGRERDPYSFVDEYTGPPPRPVEEILGQPQPKRRGRKPKHIKLMENGSDLLRGSGDQVPCLPAPWDAPAQTCASDPSLPPYPAFFPRGSIMAPNGDPLAIAAAQAAHEAKKRKWRQVGPDGKLVPVLKPRKRMDRFDGVPEDEITKKVLPDHLGPNLDIVIISKFPFQIGVSPGLFAAYKGHHYAGPGNHFWKCLFLSGLIPEPLTSDDDHQLLEHGIGFTNIVSRTTRGSSELTRKEIKEGGQILLSKLQRFQPRVAVFNGKGIYEIFSGKKEFGFGRQPEKIEGTHTHVWVMPSSSARCAQLPRALDKVPFYTALRKFRDFLKGTIPELNDEEITFTPPKMKPKLDESLISDKDGEETVYLDDGMKDDLDRETETNEEISRSITQSLYNLKGMTRDELESIECGTIPIRKKRGRPKKTPDDPNAPPRPRPKNIPTEIMLCNGGDEPRKKRGRPKKVLEDGTTPPPKRPGRKPKALKEMLAQQQQQMSAHGTPQPHHQQMGMGHLNGMMSPQGYNPSPGGPFSPQYGSQGIPTGGPLGSMQHGPSHNPMHPGAVNPAMHQGHPSVNSPMGTMGSLNAGGITGSMGPSPMHPAGGCPTPNHLINGGPQTPTHNLPPRGPTPHQFGQSPGFSPSGVPGHPTYNHPPKNEMQLEDERQLCLSPPASSPVIAQPDFEPPTSIPDGDSPVAGSEISGSTSYPPQAEKDSQMMVEGSGMNSHFSSPGTPSDGGSTPYQGYPNYSQNRAPSPPYPSPNYPSGVPHSLNYPTPSNQSPNYPPTIPPSPSYPPAIAQSPSYHPNVSQSPSYPSTNQSPSFPPSNPNHSPSFPHTSTNQSPSYPQTNPNPSPSFVPPNHSPSFPPSNSNQSPSYSSLPTHSPSYHNVPPSPSYSSKVPHSPSYQSALTQSPSYCPAMSNSPSFSTSTPSPSLGTKAQRVNSPTPMPKGDMTSKSLSGLESLVDQIPSLSETETASQHSGHSGSTSCSNPTTPAPSVGGASSGASFSPGNHAPSVTPYSNYAPIGGTPNFGGHYGSPQPAHSYSPHFSSNSTNPSTNFSVSSLANSSITTSQTYSSVYESTPSSLSPGSSGSSLSATGKAPNSTNAPNTSTNSSSFSVSSLTGGSPTPSGPCSSPSGFYSSSYSPSPSLGSQGTSGGPSRSYSDIMSPPVLGPAPSFMGSPSLMNSTSMSNTMGPMSALHSSMSMGSSQLPYPYAQYGDSPNSYPGPPGASAFPYPPSGHGFPHVPSPRFPYPAPYSASPYSQGYSQNSIMERIKHSSMGMGFGSF